MGKPEDESTAPTDPVTDEPQACPYLGLPDDSRTRFSFATPAHRCHVNRQPSPVDLGHQGVYCLSSDFPACKRYRAPAATAIPEVPSPIAPAPAPVVTPEPAPVAPPAAPTTSVLWSDLPASSPTVTAGALTAVPSSAVRTRSEPGDAPPITNTGRPNVRRRVLFLLVLVAAAVLIGAIVTGAIGPLVGRGGPGAIPTATIAASPSTTPSPSPSSAPSPSTSPTAVPSATSTASPGSSQIIHVVKPGETLTSIAAQYGVTPQAIEKANKIKDPNLIHVGQKLIIPVPLP